MLEVRNLHVSIGGKQKLKDISLRAKPGELHVIMGPNGSGKTTLAMALMGHPKYSIDRGTIFLNGEDITRVPMYERARKGLFLSFQHPVEIDSLRYLTFLLEVLKKNGKNPDIDWIKRVFEKMGLSEEFLQRNVNSGFSGGEKKRAELAQMLLLSPKYAILDEPDTGVDVDSMKFIAGAINESLSRGTGIILITHYARILNEIGKGFHVHILAGGEIKAEGGPELAEKVETQGFGD